MSVQESVPKGTRKGTLHMYTQQKYVAQDHRPKPATYSSN
jgi:hypothetical protein